VAFSDHRDEPLVADPDDCGRARVVAIGLNGAFVVEHPNPRRQLGWHIQHRFARRDQLLGDQRAQSSSAFDRPDARHVRGGELQ
jgi:hypothetical protein